MVIQALIGGLIIGLAGALLLLFNGRIMGASGIASSFISKFLQRKWASHQQQFELAWRAFFLLGMILGGVVLLHFLDGAFAPQESEASAPVLAIAGLLVGIGTRLGLGCTSGHGICGISRLSLRSVFATCLFIASGMATVYLVQLLGGN